MTAARESLNPKSHDSQKSVNPSHVTNNNLPKKREKRELVKPASIKRKNQNLLKLTFPKGNKLPVNLKILWLFQQSSSLVAFLLVSSTLYLYIWSFCLPQNWSKQYKTLEKLQRHERELTIINESLKKQLAQQAENPDAGLENFDPTTAIFMPPAKTSVNNTSALKTQSEFSKLLDRIPLGY